MAASDKPRNPDQSPQPAAASRSQDYAAEHPRDTDAGLSSGASTGAANSEIDALMERAEATMTLATSWAENFTSLVHLEFQRTLSAGKRILVLLLFLFFLAIALIVSLCAGLGLAGYYYFQSIYIGFGIFLLSQFLIVGGILLSMNRLKKMLGFDETRKQAREALNDVTALFKQTN